MSSSLDALRDLGPEGNGGIPPEEGPLVLEPDPTLDSLLLVPVGRGVAILTRSGGPSETSDPAPLCLPTTDSVSSSCLMIAKEELEEGG